MKPEEELLLYVRRRLLPDGDARLLFDLLRRATADAFEDCARRCFRHKVGREGRERLVRELTRQAAVLRSLP